MLVHQAMLSANCDDSELVSASLNGDREAFAQIVRRYQVLVASVVYSATGSLIQSEDLAQDTFVAAWKQLKSLREPGKLKSWLCGIARRSSANALRRQRHEPTQKAARLELAAGISTLEANPIERAITREQEAILWRALGQIDGTYREPLILFYRENQSIERVAESLDLSEETVRQRLSRGRRLLEERLAAFVEGALRRSAPGPSFTLGVIGALPAHTATFGTASAAAAAAKTGAATKAGAWLAALYSYAGPLIGTLAAYLGYKTDMADATSARHRQLVRRFYALLVANVFFSLGLILVAFLARSLAQLHSGLYAGLAVACALSWFPQGGLLLSRIIRGTAARRRASFSLDPGASVDRPAYEYRSRVSLLGLPLVHIRFGGTLAARRTPVKAWVAVGDVAFGGLFAAGAIAMAPAAVGGFTLGGMVFAGFGAGIYTYAGFALGVWAMGGLVVGVRAIGGCAVGWTAAAGGLAVAHKFAQGGVAIALHAGDAVAQDYFHSSAFFQNSPSTLIKYFWPALLLAALPSILSWHLGRKKRRRQEPT